jgi:hypothetical protein
LLDVFCSSIVLKCISIKLITKAPQKAKMKSRKSWLCTTVKTMNMEKLHRSKQGMPTQSYSSSTKRQLSVESIPNQIMLNVLNGPRISLSKTMDNVKNAIPQEQLLFNRQAIRVAHVQLAIKSTRLQILIRV